MQNCWAGSSPLTRGKHSDCHSVTSASGLIPAHAGKTARMGTTRVRPRAHPRSRGENPGVTMHALRHRGSSPLTRGKHRRPLRCRPAIRLIPAHAGKTLGLSQRHLHVGAHPRSRGENGQDGHDEGAPAGSSPLTRGKPRRNDARPSASRLIPAHAGKTGTTSCIRFSTWAHPRSRGENGWVCPWRWSRLGSSPLTRGKLRLGDNRRAGRGLIPAHAGKTIHTPLRLYIDRAHPRSRGENVGNKIVGMIQSGSSPLTRGKPSAARVRMTSMGLIPAHAGKTRRRASHTGGRPAHPRSRGENARHRRAHHRPPGSSPLTRGKRAAVSAAPT